MRTRKNVHGSLRWLKSAETFKPDASDKHQLIYLMDGKGHIRLNNKDYDVEKGAGIYLGPSETATIQAGERGVAEAVSSHRAENSEVKAAQLETWCEYDE